MQDYKKIFPYFREYYPKVVYKEIKWKGNFLPVKIISNTNDFIKLI